jgi:cytochrome c-type biogenesis protein CcmH/NrfF
VNGTSSAKPPARSLWLWVAAPFLLLLLAWAAIFIVARRAGIAEVPRASAQPHP